MTRVCIVGGGPGGYEAALVAAQLEASVVVVDRDGLGGAAVLADCVPSKTLIATADTMSALAGSPALGVRFGGDASGPSVDLGAVNERVRRLARAQSDDVGRALTSHGVEVLRGAGRLAAPHRVEVVEGPDAGAAVDADVVLLATGASPRVLPTARPDGERILNWQQVYDQTALPEHLVVVGSGVTGAEFASAYLSLGAPVSLVSSRERVLPGEDSDAAAVLEDVFARRGMDVVSKARAASVERTTDGVLVRCADGRTVEGSHCLMAVGSLPNTSGLGLEEAGVGLGKGAHIEVDRVSRTTLPGVYAAGDCTGVHALASVAAMQGRIAMWHALGEAVAPLRLRTVAANVFTDPEIATVGVTQRLVDSGEVAARTVKLPLSTNARAKMAAISDGFVKLFCRPGTGVVLGGVVVAPNASELVLSVSLAVQLRLTVDEIAHTFAVYPSLSGSITEGARRLMEHGVDD